MVFIASETFISRENHKTRIIMASQGSTGDSRFSEAMTTAFWEAAIEYCKVDTSIEQQKEGLGKLIDTKSLVPNPSPQQQQFADAAELMYRVYAAPDDTTSQDFDSLTNALESLTSGSVWKTNVQRKADLSLVLKLIGINGAVHFARSNNEDSNDTDDDDNVARFK